MPKLHFLNKQFSDHKKVRSTILALTDILHVLDVTEKTLRIALDSEMSDFEDAVVEVSSHLAKIPYIVTRDMADFKKSRVKAISPVDCLILVG